MQIAVRLRGDVRRHVRGRADSLGGLALGDGSSVADLLVALGIPAEEDLTIGVNGDLASRGAILRDGDEVLLLTPMTGGSPAGAGY